MWQSATSSSDQSSAVSVVPMPSVAGSASAICFSSALASAIASARACSMSTPVVSASSGASVAMATALATSPAAWPPMPSAIASRCGPA